MTFGVYAASTTDVGILRGDTTGLLIFGVGTTAGVLVEALTLIIVVKRANIPWSWHWEPRHPRSNKCSSLSGWTLGFVIANQIAAAVVVNLSRSGAGGEDADGLASAYFFCPDAVHVAAFGDSRLGDERTFARLFDLLDDPRTRSHARRASVADCGCCWRSSFRPLSAIRCSRSQSSIC
ncbi:MAG: hypothetical protein H6512_06730 [Acidimicrobiia bacterium]|nr:hypothetical protein [Acidimicrobiia bacterium]